MTSQRITPFFSVNYKAKLPAISIAEPTFEQIARTEDGHRHIVNRHKYTVYVTITVPIVEINVELKASSENLNRTQVFPTPESPINSNLNK